MVDLVKNEIINKKPHNLKNLNVKNNARLLRNYELVSLTVSSVRELELTCIIRSRS